MENLIEIYQGDSFELIDERFSDPCETTPKDFGSDEIVCKFINIETDTVSLELPYSRFTISTNSAIATVTGQETAALESGQYKIQLKVEGTGIGDRYITILKSY
jgi:hypothetical protein